MIYHVDSELKLKSLVRAATARCLTEFFESLLAAIYHTGVGRRVHLPSESRARAGSLRRHLPARGAGHRLSGWWLLRLLQIPLHPFGDQADHQHRLRRLLMVSDRCCLMSDDLTTSRGRATDRACMYVLLRAG